MSTDSAVTEPTNGNLFLFVREQADTWHSPAMSHFSSASWQKKIPQVLYRLSKTWFYSWALCTELQCLELGASAAWAATGYTAGCCAAQGRTLSLIMFHVISGHEYLITDTHRAIGPDPSTAPDTDTQVCEYLCVLHRIRKCFLVFNVSKQYFRNSPYSQVLD